MSDLKGEVLRYLGYRSGKVPAFIDGMIDGCLLDITKAAAPRRVIRTFDISLTQGDYGVQVEGTALVLPGADITAHLVGCRSVAIFAATLGVTVDNLIRMSESFNMTRAVILDAAGAGLIETVCDTVEREIDEAHGGGITTRFSPGYGDLPLEIQPRLLDVLDAGRKIGLTCTDSHILLPRKSVTAIIGIR